jgi:hypothetical protein
MKKYILFILAVLLTVFAAANAQAIGLEITDIVVEVDNDIESSADINGGTFEAYPEAEVEIEIEVRNTFPSSTANQEIEDIQIEIEVERVCDKGYSETFTFEDDFKDLDPGDDDNTFFTFEIPTCANEGRYDVDITVEGEGEDGTDYRERLDITMEMDRKGHELDFVDAVIENEIISCDRNVVADLEVHNIGAFDEDTGLRIYNAALDLEQYVEMDLQSEEDYFDEDSHFKGPVEFKVRDSAAPGEYQIRFEFEIGPDDEEFLEFADLEVQACGGSSVTTEPEPETETEVVITPPTQAEPEPEQIAEPVPEKISEQEPVVDTKEEANSLTKVLIIVGVVVGILLLVAVGLLIYFMQRD